jgi:hypothetical protein
VYFVVITENQGAILVEDTSVENAVLNTPGGVSGRVAQFKEIERMQGEQQPAKKINAS